MINREVVVGFFALALAFFMLVRSEYNTWAANSKELFEVRVDRKQAEEQILKKLGNEIIISFEQELSTKYYFKVNDPRTDSTYDVYVNKDRPKVLMLRKSSRANF